MTQKLQVGIDLGTSRSSISASNGKKHYVESYVGWPVDMVARKVLKKKVMVGTEARENRPMLDLHRPLERGLIKEGSEKEDEAVRELLSHLIGLVHENGSDTRINAVVGVPAEAMRVNKQNLRRSMQGLVNGLMIVSEPFAVAYGLEALLHTLVIDIGAGTTDFCVMMGRLPGEDDQRTLTVAGDTVDEQLLQLVREKHPDAQVTIHMVRGWKEEHSFVGKAKNPIKVEVPINGKPTEIDITEEMRIACESLVDPISETLLDLIAKIEPEFQEKVRQNIILTGGTGLIGGLAMAIQENLEDVGGGRVRVTKDPIYVGSDGGLSIASDAKAADWEKLKSEPDAGSEKASNK